VIAITRGFGSPFILAEAGQLVDSTLSVNLKRSLDKWVYDNIKNTEGIPTDFEGLPFDNSGVSEWITPRITSQNRTFYRQGSATEYGQVDSVSFRVEAYAKKSGVTVSDRHYAMRDIVANYFRIGQDIPLVDYAGDGVSTICWLRVRESIEDAPLPETQEENKYGMEWKMDFTELTAKP
jgi:hypothetical protein